MTLSAVVDKNILSRKKYCDIICFNAWVSRNSVKAIMDILVTSFVIFIVVFDANFTFYFPIC